MAQFEEDDVPAVEENDETVPDQKFVAALTNRELVARRRRIEEVIEAKRAGTLDQDYDYDIGN